MKTGWIFAIVGLLALGLFYFWNKTTALTYQAQIDKINQANRDKNPWLTVPGQISQGVQGIGSIFNSFKNLFSDSPSNVNLGLEPYGDTLPGNWY